MNLIVNARDAMDGQGHLWISVEAVRAIPPSRSLPRIEGRFIAVTVSDSGMGIPTANLTRIFEPFFTTKGVGKGTGLGLAQVFGFTSQSGGDVGVSSELGVGTTFTLYLSQALGEMSYGHGVGP